MASESKKTVYAALAANAVIAGAKLAGGMISGSSALLAEAAHSVADTTNQGFLLVSLNLGRREADERHPFGYGKERFLWSFVAALFIFVAGAVFSVGEGVLRLLSNEGESQTGFVAAYVVLAIALVAEGLSLTRALAQTRREAREAGQPFLRFVRLSRDPTSKTVVFEDTAAVTGVLIALLGVFLHQVTGVRAFDAGASIAIGALLVVVAVSLGRDTKGLLVGEAATPEESRALREAIAGHDEVEAVLELLTMALGPRSLLVAVRLDLADGLNSDQVERLSNRVEEELQAIVPSVTEVFLDATPRGSARDGHAAAIESARTGAEDRAESEPS